MDEFSLDTTNERRPDSMYMYSSGRCSYKEPIKKECIVLVGLPARGKSYISRMLCRYLNWNGHSTKMFNVGNYRRNYSEGSCRGGCGFFDPTNEECNSLRQKFAEMALNDLIEWLKLPTSRVAIFDATNTTSERRKWIYETCERHGIRVFFIESICDNEAIIERIILEAKLDSPDYAGKDPQDALEDFKNRIKNYEKVYEPISDHSESHYSFVKVVNTGINYFINNLTGFLQPKVVYYLMHTHLMDKTIYITRHGESLYNVEGKIGGDPNLTEIGQKYAELLGKFINKQTIPDLRVLTSNLKRTIQTAQFVNARHYQIKALDEIDAGECEGMTYSEIAQIYPDEYSARICNKYYYRYPRGESYIDVINRLETVILELERLKNVLIVTHQAVARCILAYFCDFNSERIPYINVPLHTVFAVTPKSYGCKIVTYTFDPSNPAAEVKVDETYPSLITSCSDNSSGHFSSHDGSSV